MKRNLLAVLPCAVLLLAVSGCASVPDSASIPPEITIVELSQKGQTALDENNYKAAEVYYRTIINRFGADSGALTSAEFEIAHIRMKQKQYAEAKEMLDVIVARYATTGGAGLPPEYLILAKNDLARIPASAAPAKSAPVKEATATAAPATQNSTAPAAVEPAK
jgi:hypothetical protein